MGRSDLQGDSRRSRTTHRFPRSVYGDGAEPDPRFSLANERTFLAWIRTSLALLAAGVALEALELPMESAARAVASVLFVLLSLLAAVQAWVGWMRTERSMRLGRALPGPTLGIVVTAGVCLGIIVVAAGFLLR
jgi:putative membrane protein